MSEPCDKCGYEGQERRDGGACLERQVARLREEVDGARSVAEGLVGVARKERDAALFDLAHTEALLEDATKHPALRCGFCGKGVRQVRRLVMGNTAGICNECAHLCADLLIEEGEWHRSLACAWCKAPLTSEEQAREHGASCAKSPWKAKYDELTVARDRYRAALERVAAKDNGANVGWLREVATAALAAEGKDEGEATK